MQLNTTRTYIFNFWYEDGQHRYNADQAFQVKISMISSESYFHNSLFQIIEIFTWNASSALYLCCHH